jgi:serine/threonine-protein kinase
MIDPGAARRILERAVEEGVLTPDEVERLAEALAEWGPELAALVQAGALSPSWIRRRLEEAGLAAAPKATGDGPAPLGRSSKAFDLCERFEIGEPLGQGGMGQVYKAYDRRLKRHVALKLLKGDDPDRVARFLREAQAQARVQHENVCKVYEASESEGKPYIAMQLVAGQPLFVADGEGHRPSPDLLRMTVDQKARALKVVAEGIHAAHREGLIHRDIKPSNIMLEPTEAGDFKPCVLDFGLAREVASPGVTSMGLAVGTPNFMAPEQARGEAGALDRRTDVYGLGATLYAILAGKPPFEGPSSLDVLVKVTEEEPPPLDTVSEDLRTIVSKCLQKEPSERYESARALAEDLGRYLEGDPILARKTSLRYRLLKKARKHKRLVAAAGAAAVVFVVLALTSVQAQLHARERARLAQVFGQEVKAIENQMRVAHLIPEHDITPVKTAIRQRMAALKTQVAEIGGVAEAPGDYALGRGYLALGEYEKAREHLERAWARGYRERDVAYALGQTVGALYERELQSLERLPDKEARAARRSQVERDYRGPALQYLQQSYGLDMDSAAYVEARVAFYERRYDDALAKARAAFASLPWLYEARELEARIYATLGREKGDHGDQTAADEDYRRAEAAYQAALEIGESDPSIPQGMGVLAESLMRKELYNGVGLVEPYFRKGVAACDRAIRIDPESAGAYQTKARLLWRMGEGEARQGRDPRDMLTQAVAAGRQALALRPDDVETHVDIETAYRMLGTYENERGLDPTANLEESNRVAEAGRRLAATEYRIPMGIGSNYGELAWFGFKHGRAEPELVRKAEQELDRAIALKPDSDIAYVNLAIVYFRRALYELDHGQDPRRSAAQIMDLARRVQAVNPRMIGGHRFAANAHWLAARRRLELGEDPRDELAQAARSYRVVLDINPRYLEALVRMAETSGMLAAFDAAHGRDPGSSLREGRTWVARALRIDPQHVPAILAEARLDVLDARWRLDRGASPEDALTRARRAGEQAVRINPHEANGYVALAETYEQLGRWRRERGESPGTEVARGLAMTHAALGVDPTHPRALALQAALGPR